MSSKTISNFPIIYFEIHNYSDEVKKALLLDEEDIVSAIEIYESFRDKYPDNYSILNNLGLLYFKEEKFEKAISCLKFACSKADKTFISECHTNLGQILFALKRYDEAREVFYKGTANNTGGSRLFPLERYARILEAIGKYEDAIDVYMGLTKEYEDAWDYEYFDSVFLWDGLGYCYNKLDKLKKAGDAYLKAKTIEDTRIAEILNSLKSENEIEPKRGKLKNTKEYRSREKKVEYITGKIEGRLNILNLINPNSDRTKENREVETKLYPQKYSITTKAYSKIILISRNNFNKETFGKKHKNEITLHHISDSKKITNHIPDEWYSFLFILSKERLMDDKNLRVYRVEKYHNKIKKLFKTEGYGNRRFYWFESAEQKSTLVSRIKTSFPNLIISESDENDRTYYTLDYGITADSIKL